MVVVVVKTGYDGPNASHAAARHMAALSTVAGAPGVHSNAAVLKHGATRDDELSHGAAAAGSVAPPFLAVPRVDGAAAVVA